MITDSMSARDIDATYRNTILGLRMEGVIEPVRVVGASDDNEMLVVSHDASFEKRLSLRDPRIVTEYPDSGAYNYKKTVVFVRRKAQRQWRRGISRNHLEIGSSNSRVDDFILARCMYNPSYVGFDKAKELIESEGFEARAITRNFWLKKDNRYENLVILFRGRVVGELIDGGINIPDDAIHDLFREAIK